MALRALRIFLNPRLPGEQNSQKRFKTPSRDLSCLQTTFTSHIHGPHLQTTFTDHSCRPQLQTTFNILKLAEDSAQTCESRAESSEKGVILFTSSVRRC